MLLNFDKSKSIILVDSSYYVFYRYFATLRWFIFQKKEINVNEITTNEEYVASFIKHMNADINKICKKWNTVKTNIVFCCDCQRCNIWRNDIFPEYKGNRVTNDNFNSSIFNVFYDNLEKLDLKKVQYDRLEADDVVYLLQNKLKIDYNIVIISNDNDYLQLSDINVDIYNMQFKDITTRGQNNPKIDLYYKVIYGDKSDNITKILNTITKDKALEISKWDEKDIKKWVKKEGCLDKFNLNLNLVSFEKIPTDIKETFYKTVSI